MEQKLKELRQQLMELRLRESKYIAEHKEQDSGVAMKIKDVKTAYTKLAVTRNMRSEK